VTHAQSRIPSPPKSEFPTKPGGIDVNARAERNTKRLRSLVIKHLQTDIKSSGRSKQSKDVATTYIKNCGFSIKDDLANNRTVRLSKVFKNDSKGGALERIVIDFESYDSRPGAEEFIFIVDVHVSRIQSADEVNSDFGTVCDTDSLVFTCSPDRPLTNQILSARSVPAGVSFLDQSVYDGPKMPVEKVGNHIINDETEGDDDEGSDDDDDEDEEEDDDEVADGDDGDIAEEEGSGQEGEGEEEGEDASEGTWQLASSLQRYLEIRGVDPVLLSNIKRYAAHRRRQDRQAGQQHLVEFLAPAAVSAPAAVPAAAPASVRPSSSPAPPLSAKRV
jgi:hypothetical protein